MSDLSLLRAVARAFLAGEPTSEQIVHRASRTLGRRWHWLPSLAKRYVQTFAGPMRPRQRDVMQFLILDEAFSRAREKYSDELIVEQWLTEPLQMQPVEPAKKWNLPAITSLRDLADWLGVGVSDLEWFADLKRLAYRNRRSKLRHYHYKVLAKPTGGIRLIEAPKSRLKDLQRQILIQILEKIPPHPAVHGFVKRRSIKTFVAPHVGQQVVLRMDLQDFFPSFRSARIQTLFRTLGYPEAVADMLGGICTNAAPHDVWKAHRATFDANTLREARELYSRPHLPQGAPTSPTLANICTYRADCRLEGLAKAIGASYTRYADDLAFSGNEKFERHADRFSTHVAAILEEEGFIVQFRKTRVMRRGVRQHLAGLVTNQHPNIRRSEFDRLKAILTNCLRLGPHSQNREAHPHFRMHLEGRVGFVESISSSKGSRLRGILEQIRWQEATGR